MRSGNRTASIPGITRFSIPVHTGARTDPRWASTELISLGAPRTLEELWQHDCVCRTDELWPFTLDGRSYEHHPNGRFRCNSGYAVIDAALAGLGLCQLPDCAGASAQWDPGGGSRATPPCGRRRVGRLPSSPPCSIESEVGCGALERGISAWNSCRRMTRFPSASQVRDAGRASAEHRRRRPRLECYQAALRGEIAGKSTSVCATSLM
jgi:hypothetical protein